MTRPYELVYIFDSALEETQINERLERFHSLLKSPETPEPITSTNHWGKRSLAYSIQGKSVGYYVVVQFDTQPDALGELERQLKLDESVLRYLIVLNDGPAPVPPRPDQGPPDKKSAGTDKGPTDKSAATDESPADKTAATDESPADKSAAADESPADKSAATDESPADKSPATDESPAADDAAGVSASAEKAEEDR